MTASEIINEIKRVRSKTLLLFKNDPPIDLSNVYAKWKICLHYNIDKVKSEHKTDIFHQWQIDNLDDGIEVVKTILLEDGEDPNQINTKLENMVNNLDLKSRKEIFLCWFTVK